MRNRPTQSILLLADSQLLFGSACRRSVLTDVRDRFGDEPPTAAYIGAANGDDLRFYSICETAMRAAGINECQLVSSSYTEREETYLRTADVILLAGGELARGWQTLCDTGMSEVIAERHGGGATLIGVSAGAILLGQRGWMHDDPEDNELFDALSLVPYVVDAHDEASQWGRLSSVISRDQSGRTGLGLPLGSGAIWHPDMTIEPVRRAITEVARRGSEVLHLALLPDDEGG